MSANAAKALTMTNNNYILNMGTLNSGSGIGSNSNYKLGTTIGQTAPGLFSGTNYIVRSGFQYVSTSSAVFFSFSVSSTLIDFGSISPTNPITRTNILSVSPNGVTGYQVTASENTPLTIANSLVTIPDTTCDAGNCSQTTAAPWTSTLTYGFGYRCDNVSGSDCSQDFATPTVYKQFANIANAEQAATVMNGIGASTNKQAQITYKVNISGAQQAGIYTNGITYIATPTF